MKTFGCVIILLCVTPIVAATSLAFLDPEHWGGKPTVGGILIMAVFGLISIPMWLTYIPTLIFTPMAMNRIVSSEQFQVMPIWRLLLNSLMIGAVVGIFLLSPMILKSLGGSFRLLMNLVGAGAIAGAVTYIAIVLLYRFLP